MTVIPAWCVDTRKGWDIEGRPDVLPEKEDAGQDIQPDVFLVTCNRPIRRCYVSSVRKLGRRSPSTSPFLKRRMRREEITRLKEVMTQKSASWSKGWKEKPRWQPGTTTSDSQRSREQGFKEDKKKSRWELVTKVSHEDQRQENILAEELQEKSQKRRLTGCSKRRNCWPQPVRNETQTTRLLRHLGSWLR